MVETMLQPDGIHMQHVLVNLFGVHDNRLNKQDGRSYNLSGKSVQQHEHHNAAHRVVKLFTLQF